MDLYNTAEIELVLQRAEMARVLLIRAQKESRCLSATLVILITGPPGSGRSYLQDYLKEKLTQVITLKRLELQRIAVAPHTHHFRMTDVKRLQQSQFVSCYIGIANSLSKAAEKFVVSVNTIKALSMYKVHKHLGIGAGHLRSYAYNIKLAKLATTARGIPTESLLNILSLKLYTKDTRNTGARNEVAISRVADDLDFLLYIHTIYEYDSGAIVDGLTECFVKSRPHFHHELQLYSSDTLTLNGPLSENLDMDDLEK